MGVCAECGAATGRPSTISHGTRVQYCDVHAWWTDAGKARRNAKARERDAAKRAAERAARPPDPDKRCPCGATFPAERNSRGQITSRKFCDACRQLRAEDRCPPPPAPPDALRCVTCECLIGLQWGGQTHADDNGNCPACARWLTQVTARATRMTEKWREGFEPIKQWPVVKSAPAGAEVAA